MRYVLLCALEMDAALKRLTLPLDQNTFCASSWCMHHTPLENPFGRLLHSFYSDQLQILRPRSFLYRHEPTLLEKMLQKAQLLPLHRPACFNTAALSHAFSH